MVSHSPGPTQDFFLPTSQDAQVPFQSEKVPALQMQSEDETDPSGEVFNEGHELRFPE